VILSTILAAYLHIFTYLKTCHKHRLLDVNCGTPYFINSFKFSSNRALVVGVIEGSLLSAISSLGDMDGLAVTAILEILAMIWFPNSNTKTNQ
jgi:hypothetical protein